MDIRINTLTELARQALDQYKADLAAGGEPVYPQWARDLQDVLSERSKLVAAVKGSHQVIDRLMARLIVLDPSFMPSKSDIWPALKANGEALAAAGAA